MTAKWDLVGDLLGGASLAARIAGQRRQQGIERDTLDSRIDLENADSVSKSGYTIPQLLDPSSGAGQTVRDRAAAAAAGKLKLEGAQADYYSGRNAAYTGAAAARASALAARTGAQGIATLQAELKKYDDMAMVDPDGSKGIYTPETATRHAALWNQFSTMQKIGGSQPAATPDSFTRAPKPGYFGQAANAVANFFTGGGSPEAPAGPAPAAAAPSMLRVRNKKTGATGSIPSGNMNPDLYEPLGQ